MDLGDDAAAAAAPDALKAASTSPAPPSAHRTAPPGPDGRMPPLSSDLDCGRQAMLDSVLADAAPELEDAIAGVPVEHEIMVSILRNMLMATGKLERLQAMLEHDEVLAPNTAQLLQRIEAGPADAQERLRGAVRELRARQEASRATGSRSWPGLARASILIQQRRSWRPAYFRCRRRIQSVIHKAGNVKLSAGAKSGHRRAISFPTP
jgi:hypothetical protein